MTLSRRQLRGTILTYSRSNPHKRYSMAFMVGIAAAILPTMGLSQPAQTWRRSAMHQGYYAAYVANASGAELRILCAPASDSDKTNVDQLTYVPAHTISRRPELPGTISVDGAAQKFVFKAEKTGPSSGPVPTISIRWKLSRISSGACDAARA